MKQNSSISAKEPPQSFVPGLLITFLKEKGCGDKEGSKTQYNKSAKEAYLNLKPEKQAEIFAEFYSKYSARNESGELIHPAQKQELEEGIAQHIQTYQGAKVEEIPQPPKDKAASKSWYESLQNGLYSSLATLGTLAVSAGFLEGAAADDPARGSNSPTFDPTSRPTFVPTIFPTYSPSVNPTVAPSSAPSFSQVPNVISSVISTIQNTYNATFNSTSNATNQSSFPSPSPSLADVARGDHDQESDWDKMVDNFQYWGREHPLALSGVVVGVAIVVVGGCCIGYMCCKTQEQERVAPAPNDVKMGNPPLRGSAEPTTRIERFNLDGMVKEVGRDRNSSRASGRHPNNDDALFSRGEGDDTLPQPGGRRGGGERVGQGDRTSNRPRTAGPSARSGGGGRF